MKHPLKKKQPNFMLSGLPKILVSNILFYFIYTPYVYCYIVEKLYRLQNEDIFMPFYVKIMNYSIYWENTKMICYVYF